MAWEASNFADGLSQITWSVRHLQWLERKCCFREIVKWHEQVCCFCQTSAWENMQQNWDTDFARSSILRYIYTDHNIHCLCSRYIIMDCPVVVTLLLPSSGRHIIFGPVVVTSLFPVQLLHHYCWPSGGYHNNAGTFVVCSNPQRRRNSSERFINAQSQLG